MLHSGLRIMVLATLMCALSSTVTRAEPIDLEGSWATDVDNCAKVFVRKEGRDRPVGRFRPLWRRVHHRCESHHRKDGAVLHHQQTK